MKDSSVNPDKSNVEHLEVYEYDSMNGVISEAGNEHDLGLQGKVLNDLGLTRVLVERRF